MTNVDRVSCYIDGFNLYFGMRSKGLRPYYWLDLRKLSELLVGNNRQLVRVVYGTARISGSLPEDGEDAEANRRTSRERQLAYLEALEATGGVDIVYGKFLSKQQTCFGCQKNWTKPEEKMTDVQLATQILCDAFEDNYDTAFVISGDSDLVPPIRAIRRMFPKKRVVVAFPPNRTSVALRKAAHEWVEIWTRTIQRAQLPDVVMKPDGVEVSRPLKWS